MRVRLPLGLVLGSAFILLAGCGSGPKYAPVSGRVTLNGKPLANATVSFQPIAHEGSIEAAPGSSGKTNANGEYTLSVSPSQSGAWVGKHRVMVSSLAEQVGESDARPPRGGWPIVDKVPTRYNKDSKETFEVPSGGTDKADFTLTSP
jgi:hypothetical protein